jgi:hypothetical protein
MAAFSVPYAGFDYFALKWHAWVYGTESTFNIQFGAELETYLYAAVVTFLVVGATLRSAARIDRANTRRYVHIRTRQSKKGISLKPVLRSSSRR